jgi:hypothetical protein
MTTYNPDEYWHRVERRILNLAPQDRNGCWIWTARIGRDGYGRMTIRGKVKQAHIASTTKSFVGPIADGLHIDHLCHVRACVNPRHLAAVTQAENNRRSTQRTKYVRRRENPPGEISSAAGEVIARIATEYERAFVTLKDCE